MLYLDKRQEIASDKKNRLVAPCENFTYAAHILYIIVRCLEIKYLAETQGMRGKRSLYALRSASETNLARPSNLAQRATDFRLKPKCY